MTFHEQSSAHFLANFWQSDSVRRWLALLVVAGIVLIMGVYTLSEPSHLHASAALDGSDWVGYALCHRITERSFTINGRQFPLCARCTGMYLGVMLVLTVVALSGRLRRSELPAFPLVLILLTFIGLMGIDGLNSYSHFFPNAPHLYTPRNWLRLATGMGTGVAMGIFILPILAQTLWRKSEYQAVIGSLRELGGLLLVAAILVFLILSNRPLLLYVMALASSAGLLLIVLALNTIVLLVLLRLDARAERWRETAVPLTIGLLLAIIELSAVSILRYSVTGTMTGFPGL